jgi:hypothetical protein
LATTAVEIGAEERAVENFLQGVEIKTYGQYRSGITPVVRAGDGSIIIVGGRRVDNLRTYDENFSTAVGTEKVEEYPKFETEQRSFGVPRDFTSDSAYEDMQRFDPVVFIEDNGSTLIYPQVLLNTTANNVDSYDGAIEPLTIRARASRNSIDWPYESHDVRGALSNAAEDVRRRSNRIVDFVFPVDLSVEPYLDEIFEQDTLGLSQPPFLSAPSDNDTPFTEGSDWEDNANLLSGEIRAALLLSRQSKDQMFPRGSTSARCGQIVSLADSPGTDSITYAGMKR